MVIRILKDLCHLSEAFIRWNAHENNINYDFSILISGICKLQEAQIKLRLELYIYIPLAMTLPLSEDNLRRLNNAPESEQMTENEDETSTQYTYSTDVFRKTTQEEWEENLIQIKTLLNFVILPVLGKVLGRKFSLLVWKKFAEWLCC